MSVEAIAAMPAVAADAARATVGVALEAASPAATTPAAKSADAVPEATEDSLAARELAYWVLHALLSQPPTRGNVEVALSDVFAQALELVGVPGAADTSNAAADLAQQRATFERDPEGYTRAAADEYQRLFYAPGRLAAPPWESSWRSAERKVFQRGTLEVRDAYRAQGFRPVSVNRIPDDHVSIELCFMAQLANRAKGAAAGYALEEPNAANRPAPASPAPHAQASATAAAPHSPCPCKPADAASSALAASKAFLADHLGRWADDYATALAQASGTGFYAYIARCLRELVHADARWLDQRISHAGAAGNPPVRQAASNRPAQAPSPAVLAS